MKKADMGIGVLIILIAIIVVASITAAILITSTDFLQQKSVITGAAARKKITNNYVIDMITGTSNDDRELDRFQIRVSLLPGSDPGFLNLTSVADLSSQASGDHWYKRYSECIFDAVNGFFLIRSDPITPKYDSFRDSVSSTFDFGPSDFMMGKIAVAFVYVESTGAVDANLENWERPWHDDIESKFTEAFNWWRMREPRAGIQYAYKSYRDVQISYEPITRELTEANRDLWMGQAFDKLSVSPGPIDTRADMFTERLRKEFNANWGLVVFVVNNANDADSLFPGVMDEGIATDSYIVVPAGNLNVDLSRYAARELGRVFGALYQDNCVCNDVSGYLETANENCNNACTSNEMSIMRHDNYDAYRLGQVDKYARAQVGLIDLNENDILDPVDVRYYDYIFSEKSLAGLNFEEYEVGNEQKGFFGIEYPAGTDNYGKLLPGESVTICYEPSGPVLEKYYYEVHVVPTKGQHATAKIEMPVVIPKSENLVVFEAFK